MYIDACIVSNMDIPTTPSLSFQQKGDFMSKTYILDTSGKSNRHQLHIEYTWD